MFKSHHHNNPILVTLLSIIVFACTGPSASEKHAQEEEKQIREDIVKLVSDLPHPTDIPNAIKSIGADFNHGLISEIHGRDYYKSNGDKAALNLGVFSSDIGYLIAYDEVAESIDHMRACDNLAMDLGVPTSYSTETIQKYQDAVDDHETLLKLWDETVLSWEERFDNAENLDQLTMESLVLTGSFIEELYLIIKVAETYHTDDMDEDTRNQILEPLIKLVLNQEQPLLDIIKLLRELPLDDTIGTMIAELSILEKLFQGDLEDVQRGMAQDEDFVVTQDMMLDIRLEVGRIREEIVKLSS